MKYRKLPVVIEAIKYQVELGNNRVMNWLSQQGADITNWTFHDGEITIPTLEGDMKATAGDFIIKGIKGEFYPCKADIFEATYEPVLEASSPTTVQEAMCMDDERKARLLTETRETADRLNKLNAFMATDAFPLLPREDKDLLYSQQRTMSQYVQILGKRLERAGKVFEHAKEEAPSDPYHCPICKREHIIRSTAICKQCDYEFKALYPFEYPSESPSLTDAQRAVANGEHE